jgi:hypothetical protein|tara:strand:- start:585 stop:770 length:186 start_codon:yes stop_codon:yes gene_type:complete
MKSIKKMKRMMRHATQQKISEKGSKERRTGVGEYFEKTTSGLVKTINYGGKRYKQELIQED